MELNNEEIELAEQRLRRGLQAQFNSASWVIVFAGAMVILGYGSYVAWQTGLRWSSGYFFGTIPGVVALLGMAIADLRQCSRDVAAARQALVDAKGGVA